MTELRGKVVAVTGAGSGIGRGLADALVRRGASVALSDVNAEGLAETAALLRHGATVKVTTHVVDVSDRAAVERYAADAEREHGGVDVIINNAGVSNRVSIEDASYDDIRFVLDVNLWGVIHGVKAFLPLLRRRPEGHVVNISSLNAMLPFAKGGPYNISKYGVLGLTETLMQEFRGTKVRATCVHPGGIKTNIARNARGMTSAEVKLFDRIARTSPAEAARVILDGVEGNRERVYVGVDAKVLATAKRVFPALAVRLAGVATWNLAGCAEGFTRGAFPPTPPRFVPATRTEGGCGGERPARFTAPQRYTGA